MVLPVDSIQCSLCAKSTSPTNKNLGAQIQAVYASYAQKGPELVLPVHKAITSALNKLEKHLEGHRNHFLFKVRTALSRLLPCFFQSPERPLKEKLDQMQALKTLVETQYSSLRQREGSSQVRTLSDKEQEELHHELCEMDEAGRPGTVKCSNARLIEIVRLLKNANRLSLLDAVPKKSYNGWNEREYHSELDRPTEVYTPLHYWAKEGNLQNAKLLLENGAHDYVPNGASSANVRSAAHFAALYGHSEVLTHLLQHGSRLDRAFEDNPHYFFVPQLVFDFISIITEEFSSKPSAEKLEAFYACFRMVLEELQRKDPSALEKQLKIPIKDGVNSIDFIVFCLGSELKPSDKLAIPPLIRLKELLLQFGARSGHVFSDAAMKEMPNGTSGDYLYHHGALM